MWAARKLTTVSAAAVVNSPDDPANAANAQLACNTNITPTMIAKCIFAHLSCNPLLGMQQPTGMHHSDFMAPSQAHMSMASGQALHSENRRVSKMDEWEGLQRHAGLKHSFVSTCRM